MNRCLFELWYRIKRPPWDAEAVSPRFVELLRRLAPPVGRALDVGCGAGTHAVYLASQGWEVTAVDFSGAALRLARRRAGSAGVVEGRLAFVQDDVTRASRLAGPFDLVLDKGCLHAVSARRRPAYVSQITRLARPGATYLLWALPPGASLARGVSEPEVRARFEPAFDVLGIEPDPHGRGTWYALCRRGP